MELKDWVIVVQRNYYHTHAHKAHGKLDDNFHDAIVYKNMTKEEVEAIAKKEYEYVRCFWWVTPYDEELKNYESRVYADPKTKQFKWGRYLEIKDALKMVEQGLLVGYQINGESWFLEDGKLPDYIRTDVVMKATWREVLKA